ncbi:MAG: radical SAM protein [Bacteroidales bacterium]|jgi:uncharacterized protein|nr:radical SAM protein [Bacteroidales bacterium]
MEMLLKFSYYNFIIPVKEKNVYILYNSLNNSLIEVSWEIGEKLITLKSDEIHFLPQSVINTLVENGNIIPDSTDEQALILQRELACRKKLANEPTSHVVIALTNMCNMRCVYCYEELPSSKDDMDIEKMKQILAQIINSGIKHLDIRWFGGEPLLKADIINELSTFMIELCAERNIGYSANIITNGTLLNQKNWDILLKSKVSTVQITVDGGSSSHNKKRILPGRGSFDLILDNLRLMPDNSFKVALRINGDKEVFETIPEFFITMKERELWPHKHKNIKLDYAQKFYFKNGKNESIDIYYSSYEYQTAQKEFIKIKLQQMNHFYKEKKKREGRIVYGYPKPAIFYCNVTENKNNIVIDGKGSLYKCYASIGNDEGKIGSIDNFNIEKNIDQSLCNFNKIQFSDCKLCKILPICEQNCNYAAAKRVRSYTCSPWKFFMEERMKGYYLQTFHKDNNVQTE